MRDVILVVVAALAFATSGPLGKVATSIAPTTVASVRCGIAAVILIAVSPRAFAAALRGLNAKQRGAVVLAGVLLAAHFALFLGGLGATSLAAAVALVSLEPLAVVLAAFLAFGIRPTPRETAGVVLATSGAIVVASGAGVGEHRIAGDLMVLGAVALYGAYVASARGLRNALPGLPYAASVYGTACLALLPFAIPASLHAEPPTTNALLAVVALGLVPTLIGHTLMQLAARRVAPALVALVSPGETVGSLAIATLFMGAAPTSREAAGAVLVLAGATIAVTARR